MKRNLYKKKSKCCGCETCVISCPKGIVSMVPDAEGFYYPQITQPELCINCNRCQKVCPTKNVRKVENFMEKAIAGFSSDPKEVKASASGGLATAIAKGFLHSGNGVVYGVAYTDDYSSVEYKRATSDAELEAFRTSKYVQARKNRIFDLVRRDLNEGFKVLFFGLPCDVYALQLFLNAENDNLYLCALMCHGPSSLEVHRQYVNGIKMDSSDSLSFFSVRYKEKGWKPYYIKARFASGREFLERFDSSMYGIAFLNFKRPSCNVCSIKRSKIHSDITIGDYHIASGGQTQPYNHDGVSSGIVHTAKGDYLLSVAEDFIVENVTVKNVMYSEAYHRCIPARRNRSEFGRVFGKEGLSKACAISSIKRIDRQIQTRAKVKAFGARVKKRFLGGR